MEIKIFLDDVREPPDKSWILCKAVGNVNFLLGLYKNENIHISFDHDLGDNRLSGYDLAKSVERRAHLNQIKRITWDIHSANPVGRRNIEMAMTSADKYWTQHEKENK